MNPIRIDPPPPEPPKRRWSALTIYGGLAVAFIIFFVFPWTLRIVETAARQLRVLWWLVLIVVLVLWLSARFRRKR
ncbi:MAG: hypothetical protein JSR82_11380 [Verrucomicrobia bacterium]|nr:hypothetical protein [Verrucomicrobiota bacterium]